MMLKDVIRELQLASRLNHSPASEERGNKGHARRQLATQSVQNQAVMRGSVVIEHCQGRYCIYDANPSIDPRWRKLSGINHK